ncbi:unnamed protein product [Tetraodon nigroviridis]|uniref:Chromosome 13 SCAF14566, whole genome shotgun sequence n=1 Tax=Tetraodon nigroviridis TaxID=99883 RepID=Q4SKD7_TETNG|nr:unnamed protein product [Tetraodon nigroviridis]
MEVMQVVREQITRTLSSKPTSLELFKNKVNALNYSEILKLRQTERLHQEETLLRPCCEELKERLKPELLELIRQQRLNRLCQGTMFRKISSRRRQDKRWFCRLSPNHKMLHYGDVDDDEVLDLAFSITYDVEEYSLNFIAPSRTDVSRRKIQKRSPSSLTLAFAFPLFRFSLPPPPPPPSVLPVDGRAERAPGPGDEQRVHAQRAGDPAVHGDTSCACWTWRTCPSPTAPPWSPNRPATSTSATTSARPSSRDAPGLVPGCVSCVCVCV